MATAQKGLDPTGVLATAPLAPWPLTLRQAAQAARLGLVLFDHLQIFNLGGHLNLENLVDIDVHGIGRIEGETFRRPLVPARLDFDLAGLLDPRTVFKGNDALAVHTRDLSAIAAAGVIDISPVANEWPGQVHASGLLTEEQVRAQISADEVVGTLDSIREKASSQAGEHLLLANTVQYSYWFGNLAGASGPTTVPIVSGVVPGAIARELGGATRQAPSGANAQYLAQRLILSAMPGFFELPIERLLQVREDMRVPMLNFRAAVAASSRDVDVESEVELVAHWIEQVKPELGELAEAYQSNSLLRTYLQQVSGPDVLAASSGVLIALQSPGSFATALALAFPALFTGVRVHLGRQADERERQADHPYLLLHELGKPEPRPNRAERRRRARAKR